jgi:hypothetical protein
MAGRFGLEMIHFGKVKSLNSFLTSLIALKARISTIGAPLTTSGKFYDIFRWVDV